MLSYFWKVIVEDNQDKDEVVATTVTAKTKEEALSKGRDFLLKTYPQIQGDLDGRITIRVEKY
jgi:hypothetical protein